MQGTACGLAVEGSGWVAGRELVVTNAHVVAGQDDTTVEVDEDGIDAPPVVFDSRNDIAVLRVPGLDAPALRQAYGREGRAPVAILGYPEDGPYRAGPAAWDRRRP